MACRLNGTKPLFAPMMEYCQLDPKEHYFNEKLLGIQKFSIN